MLNHNAELSELGEEVGEGLAHACRISQADSGHAQPKHAKAHCDAMIAVCLDLRPAQGARIDPERVTDLLHVGTAFRQLGTQGFDAFAFLDSQPAKVDEQRGSRSKGCKHDRSHYAIGQVRAAGIGGLPRPSNDEIVELLVDLHAASRGRPHSDAASAVTQKPLSSPEIAGARRIRLHVIDASTPRKIVYQASCHLHVGQFLLIAASDRHFPTADTFAEKQCGCKLRAFFDTDAACCGVTRAGAVNDGRKAVVCAVDAITELAQGTDQRGLWSLVHARDTAHAVSALAETQERWQEARSCAGIRDKELERLRGRPGVGDSPAASVNREGAVRRLGGIIRHGNGEAQALETVHHRLRVLTPEGTAQDYGIARKSRQKQGPIGEALRARQDDGCIGLTARWNNFDEVRQHSPWTMRRGRRLRNGSLHQSGPTRFPSPTGMCPVAPSDRAPQPANCWPLTMPPGSAPVASPLRKVILPA